MYFKVKLLIWYCYKVHFLKVYLSVLGNSHESVSIQVHLIVFLFQYLEVRFF